MNILLVEDEPRVADFVSRGLKGEGFSVTIVPDGETALEFLKQTTFDIVLLDVILPGICGKDVCRNMRAKKDYTPVMMLTALNEVHDRVAGLNIGADDYLSKPFDFEELIARIHALIRRSRYTQDSSDYTNIQTCGRIVFDRQSFIVTVDGTAVELSDKEREILSMFMINEGKVLARERILNSVWGANSDPLTNVIDVYVGRLRKKLKLSKQELKNIRGVGYRFSSPEPTAQNCTSQAIDLIPSDCTSPDYDAPKQDEPKNAQPTSEELRNKILNE
ncbi:response regulator transcription factor [Marinibactrum halimedae]|uniref:DNA-binding response regulator n=1 Tax=Marinibactrum halimedae TaxID=1444977 RepID=A0AA37WQR3_9GAMM|nr:response regulator transcription factor [Marinibactrum halimedae]MCD9461315.1 response regulator transcription factor [Marinibactrum halimedae]GLS27682.1 DNA-binding response regulator [Marinibactrum halimedae]